MYRKTKVKHKSPVGIFLALVQFLANSESGLLCIRLTGGATANNILRHKVRGLEKCWQRFPLRPATLINPYQATVVSLSTTRHGGGSRVWLSLEGRATGNQCDARDHFGQGFTEYFPCQSHSLKANGSCIKGRKGGNLSLPQPAPEPRLTNLSTLDS